MYILSKNIRVRNCGDMIFFVNIKSNSIINVKAAAFQYLEKFLDAGLTEEILTRQSESFKKFVAELKKVGVMENCNER